MNNGRRLFLLLMGMVAMLYTAFVVIGQDDGPAVDGAGAAVSEVSDDSSADGGATNVVVVEDGAGDSVPADADVDPVSGADGVAEDAAVVEDAAAVPPVETVGEAVGESTFVPLEADSGEIEGASAKKDGEGTISISLDDVEMPDVVRMFTRISGANIIASPSNLVGRVTANLDEVEWRSAMETILDMHNLSLMESPPGSKIYRIDPKVPGAPEPMKVQTFFLKYAQVSNATSVVNAMLTPGGTLQPFPSRNAMVIRSTKDNLGQIEEIIASIDKLRDQVFIEAKFMELNDSAIKNLGINWQSLQGYEINAGNLGWKLNEDRNWSQSRNDTIGRVDSRNYNDNLTKMYDIDGIQIEDSSTTYEEAPPGSGVYVPTTIITPTRDVVDNITKSQDKSSDIAETYSKTAADVRTAVLGAADFKLVLSALKQMDGVQIVSNPKIIVANEEMATIHIGQIERPFEAVVTPATQVESSTTKYTPGVAVNYGVSLEVTPTINTASNITIRIMPELTRFIRNSIAPDGATYPIVASKKIQTMFCLESGKTVAIGGLTETTESERTTKIPLLGDIPLIGKYLFSHSRTERDQKETIIFVTVGLAYPESVNQLDGLPEDTELTHNKLLQSRLRRYEFNEQLEKDREKIEEQLEKTERVKSHLQKTK